MRDAHDTRRRAQPTVALNVLGIFGLFKKKEAPVVVPPRIEVVTESPPPPPAPPPHDPTIRDSVRFKGLHEDVNPSGSVRPAEMTCPNCDRHFRYFVNANGAKTVCHCPGCGRQFRV